MATFKQKLQERIVAPAAQTARVAYEIATVTKADEKSNLCSVTFVDKDGRTSNKDNVEVMLYSSGIVDWFPSVNDKVCLEGSWDSYVITRPYSSSYTSGLRTKNQLRSDTLTNSFTDTMCGQLF
jgi:hypothetical protein